jgi:YfiH family protein
MPTADPPDTAAERGAAGLRWRPAAPGQAVDGGAGRSAAATLPSAGDWPPVLVAEDLLERGVVAAFTTRVGGTSARPFDSCNLGLRVGDDPRRVLANRRRVLTVLGLAGRPLATMRQVHGANVAVVGPDVPGQGPPEGRPPLARDQGADVLVTTSPGPALMALTADCVPVLLADPAARVVAAVHAGWRGLAAGAVEAGVAALAAAGADPGRTVALVGPCIGPAAYEVGPDVLDQVAGRYPDAAATTAGGRPSLDLAAAATAALAGAGVAGIRVGGECTHDQPDRFFSFRREGTTGRQAGIVALAPVAGP